jgi:hypothetical protein
MAHPFASMGAGTTANVDKDTCATRGCLASPLKGCACWLAMAVPAGQIGKVDQSQSRSPTPMSLPANRYGRPVALK